ncbi:FGGY family carbohydrate kinase [Angustibacter speluncae]
MPAQRRAVLAVDEGTTGVTVLLVGVDDDEAGTVLARGYEEFPQHFPRPGWVEHQPEEIWQATIAAARTALDEGDANPGGAVEVVALGITDQRETAVLWDRSTLASPRRAVVWQDRRSADVCTRLREAGHEERVAELTGLRLDPYFTATKLAWLAEHDTRSWAGVEDGSLAIGTVDSYLVARLSGGARHVTDASNASRTLLLDLRSGEWSDELCELFGVPRAALPEVVPSWGEVARTDPSAFLGLDVPISGIAGDQQAALFGQACFEVGDTKCTYGTGSFVLVNTGSEPVAAPLAGSGGGDGTGLLSTIAWMSPDGERTYAQEGSIFVTGAAVQWLRDGLQIVGSAAETEAVARTVPDTGGVVFVPALTGLGAPEWDPQARGTILGLTRGTTRAHLVRATLEAIAYEVRDVLASIEQQVPVLRVDGGASGNDWLMQWQSDQLAVPVERPTVLETTGMGAAFLAGLGAGVWSSQDEVAQAWRLDRRFEPGERDEPGYRRWRAAVERSKGWADLVD